MRYTNQKQNSIKMYRIHLDFTGSFSLRLLDCTISFWIKCRIYLPLRFTWYLDFSTMGSTIRETLLRPFRKESLLDSQISHRCFTLHLSASKSPSQCQASISWLLTSDLIIKSYSSQIQLFMLSKSSFQSQSIRWRKKSHTYKAQDHTWFRLPIQSSFVSCYYKKVKLVSDQIKRL